MARYTERERERRLRCPSGSAGEEKGEAEKKGHLE